MKYILRTLFYFSYLFQTLFILIDFESLELLIDIKSCLLGLCKLRKQNTVMNRRMYQEYSSPNFICFKLIDDQNRKKLLWYSNLNLVRKRSSPECISAFRTNYGYLVQFDRCMMKTCLQRGAFETSSIIQGRTVSGRRMNDKFACLMMKNVISNHQTVFQQQNLLFSLLISASLNFEALYEFHTMKCRSNYPKSFASNF